MQPFTDGIGSRLPVPSDKSGPRPAKLRRWSNPFPVQGKTPPRLAALPELSRISPAQLFPE